MIYEKDFYETAHLDSLSALKSLLGNVDIFLTVNALNCMLNLLK